MIRWNVAQTWMLLGAWLTAGCTGSSGAPADSGLDGPPSVADAMAGTDALEEASMDAAAPGDGTMDGGPSSNATTYYVTLLHIAPCTGANCPCLPQQLTTNPSDVEAPCAMFFVLAAGDTCAAHGLSSPAPDVVASLETFESFPSSQPFCVVPQLPIADTVDASCVSSSQLGWCYDRGAAAQGCSQRIDLSASAMPPTGASALLACGQTPSSSPTQGTSPAPVGTSCTPSSELSPSFGGFDFHEIALDEDNAACSGDVCLVNHFQGLTSCPYGQTADGGSVSGATSACTVPGSGAPVAPSDPVSGARVSAQCVNRPPSTAVYCSCRCQNDQGATDDGASYCTCPTGYSCTQVVPASQPGDPRAGGYCIKNGTAFDPNSGCPMMCDPSVNPCP